MGKQEAKYCACVATYFDITKLGEDQQGFGYYILQAKTDPAHEDCLNQVQAAHAGDAWAPIPLIKGCYGLKCHYTVCANELAALGSIL